MVSNNFGSAAKPRRVFRVGQGEPSVHLQAEIVSAAAHDAERKSRRTTAAVSNSAPKPHVQVSGKKL